MKKAQAAVVALLILTLTALTGCLGASSSKSKAGADLENMTAAELERKGDGFAQQGKEKEALTFYDKAMEAGAEKDKVYFKIGSMFLVKDDWKKALAGYRAAIGARNDFPAALYGAGYCSFMLDNMNDAEAFLKKSAEFGPEMSASPALLGVVFNKQNKPEQAIAAFEQALKISPEDPEILNNMAISKFMIGDFEGSVAALRAALKIKESPRSFNNLGLSLCALKRYGEAFEAFTAATTEAAAYNNVGACYERAGDMAKAKEYYEKAVETNPRFYIKASENLTRMNAGQTPTLPMNGAKVGGEEGASPN